ncbi:MAG TPA: hypothetical protein V6C97_32895 [Oculatellaceae cyanobacterium]
MSYNSPWRPYLVIGGLVCLFLAIVVSLGNDYDNSYIASEHLKQSNSSDDPNNPNHANKVRCVYELASAGDVVATYTVKGKVSSITFPLTNTQNHEEHDSAGGTYDPSAVNSISILTINVNLQPSNRDGQWRPPH